MKVAKITGKHECKLADMPDLKAKDDYVVVKIHSAPMCTEFYSYDEGDQPPYIGHEAAGEVVEIARPGRVKVGDRVVVMPQYPCGKCDLCLGGNYIHCLHDRDVPKETGGAAGRDTFAEYILKPDWLLVPIPDGISYDHASMACCGLGPSFGGMQLANVTAFDTVLVTGLGPVGLGGVVNARYRGARVIGADNNPYRADLAKELGAEAVVDPTVPDAVDRIKELTDGLGVTSAIECSGRGAAAVLCVRSCRRKGRVALVGASGDFTLNGWGDIISQGLSIHGAWHWNLADAARIMRVVAGSAKLLDKQITHTFPLSEVRDAWELQLSGKCGKVILHPWE